MWKISQLGLLALESQGIHLHLVHHGEHTIGTGRGEVLLEADLVDEVEVGLQDLVRCVAVLVTQRPSMSLSGTRLCWRSQSLPSEVRSARNILIGVDSLARAITSTQPFIGWRSKP